MVLSAELPELPPFENDLVAHEDFMDLTQLERAGESRRVKIGLIIGKLAARIPNQSSKWLCRAVVRSM